mgnify:CR=1 FL=1
MIDRSIFEDRLTFKETTITGHTAVSRLVARFNAFVNAAAVATGGVGGGGGAGEEGGEEGVRELAFEQYDALVKEMMLMRLEVRTGGRMRGGGWTELRRQREGRCLTHVSLPRSLPQSILPSSLLSTTRLTRLKPSLRPCPEREMNSTPTLRQSLNKPPEPKRR